MKHFEDIWNESESLADSKDALELIYKAVEILNQLTELKKNGTQEQINEAYGLLLYNISGLTKIHNINIAAAMNFVNDQIKIDRYG